MCADCHGVDNTQAKSGYKQKKPISTTKFKQTLVFLEDKKRHCVQAHLRSIVSPGQHGTTTKGFSTVKRSCYTCPSVVSLTHTYKHISIRKKHTVVSILKKTQAEAELNELSIKVVYL